MTGKNGNMLRVITNLIAFILLVVITGLLIAGKVSGPQSNFSVVCEQLSKYLSILLVALASFWYAFSKRSLVIRCLWVLCVVAIVVLALI